VPSDISDPAAFDRQIHEALDYWRELRSRRTYARLADALIARHADLTQDGPLTLQEFTEHRTQAPREQIDQLARLADAEAGAATHVGPTTVARLRSTLGWSVTDAEVTGALERAGVRVVVTFPELPAVPHPKQADLAQHVRQLGKRLSAEVVFGDAVRDGFHVLDGFRLADSRRLDEAALDEARCQAAGVLAAATPATALGVLEWAAASEVALPDAELEEYGRTRLDPGTPEPELTAIVGKSPAVLRGLIDRLAGEPPEVAEALLAGPAGNHIRRSDLAAYPVLTELWLLESAARGGLAPLEAFDEIADVRARAQRSPRVDAVLLRRLWPAGCPPEEIAELLSAVTGEGPAPGVLDWFAAEIGAVAASRAMNDGSLRLAQALAGHPVLGMLPEGDARIMRNAARVEPLLRQTRSAGPQGDVAVFAELFDAYLDVDDDTRSLLDRHLPPLLSEAEPLSEALRGCPDGVAAAFCRELGTRLAPPPDVTLARRVFVAMTDPDVVDQPALTDRLPAAFGRVRGWRRRDLGLLARALADDEELADLFQAWRDEQRSGLARRLFGPGEA
jgi:hypothetical protein